VVPYVEITYLEWSGGSFRMFTVVGIILLFLMQAERSTQP
jgi:hypothetical protein